MSFWETLNISLTSFGGAILALLAVVKTKLGNMIVAPLLEQYKSSLRKEENKTAETYRHELQTGLENIKAEINKGLEEYKVITGRLLDRKTRLNEKEFEGLAECWAALTEAFCSAYVLCLKSYSEEDISQIEDQKLDDILSFYKLNKGQISFIKKIDNPSKKNHAFAQCLRHNELSLTEERVEVLMNKVEFYSIFIIDEIIKEFREIYDVICDSVLEKRSFLIRPPNHKAQDERKEDYLLIRKDKEYHNKKEALYQKIKERLNDIEENK